MRLPNLCGRTIVPGRLVVGRSGHQSPRRRDRILPGITPILKGETPAREWPGRASSFHQVVSVPTSASAAASWRSRPDRTCRRRSGNRLPRGVRVGRPVGRGDLLGRPVEDPRREPPPPADRDHPPLGIGHLLGRPSQQLAAVDRRVLVLPVLVAAGLAAVVVAGIPPIAAPGPASRVGRFLALSARVMRPAGRPARRTARSPTAPTAGPRATPAAAGGRPAGSRPTEPRTAGPARRRPPAGRARMPAASDRLAGPRAAS